MLHQINIGTILVDMIMDVYIHNIILPLCDSVKENVIVMYHNTSCDLFIMKINEKLRQIYIGQRPEEKKTLSNVNIKHITYTLVL